MRPSTSKDCESFYGPALELYASTTLTVREICERTDVPVSAFSSYLRRCHRELMFARKGILLSADEASRLRMRRPSGQTAAAHEKYKDAIAACDDSEYLEYNVSQIARMFCLDPTALGNQLRRHYPDIVARRERERLRMGIGDNMHRGVLPLCDEQYALAVEHLRRTEDTVRQTANLFGLSYTGLREHLLYYHKDLVGKRAAMRKDAIGEKQIGALTGTGSRHLPLARQTEKYKDAIRLYRNSAMGPGEIEIATGVSIGGVRNYLRTWLSDLITNRRVDMALRKYAGAIERLKGSGLSTAEVAREFGLNPDTFREYLREHDSELAERFGMTRLESGRVVLARSAEKYEEALRLFETSSEPLKSIASRLGLQYDSLGSFIRRNYPEAHSKHRKLVQAENMRKNEKNREATIEQAIRKREDEKQRIIDALRETGNRRREAAALLEMGKSTFYNKLKAYGLL